MMDWMHWVAIVEIPVALFVFGVFARALSELADKLAEEMEKESAARTDADGRLHKRIDDALQAFATCRVDCVQRFEKYVTKEDQHRDSDEIKGWLKRIEDAINGLRESRR